MTDKNPWRFAKEGDILFSSIPFLTWKEQVHIAKKDYKTSQAIYTLTFSNDEKGENMKKYVYEYLMNNKNNVLKDAKSLSDGFKVSKLKIDEFNLMNNIWFIEEEKKAFRMIKIKESYWYL